MSDTVTQIVKNLLDGIHGIAKSETIIGEPQQAGDAMILPIHRLKVGFGAGSTKGDAEGTKTGGKSGLMGAGGSVELEPIAAIAVGRDGKPRILTVESDMEGAWAALLQEVPDILMRLTQSLGQRVNAHLSEADDHAPEASEKAPSKARLPAR